MEGNFLSWGAGARSGGLGKAYVGIANDASASYWNPGGLMQVDGIEIQALHTLLWEGVNYDYIGFAYPTMTEGVFGLNVVMLRAGDVERRDSNNNLMESKFGSMKTGTTIGYGRKIFSWLDIGISIKHIGRWLDGESTGFITGDIGMMIRTGNLDIGIVGQHVGYMKYGDTEDKLLPKLKLGIGYKLLEGAMTIAGGIETMVIPEMKKYIKDLLKWQVGIEYAMIGPFSIRAGMDGLMPSAGIGFKYNHILKMDYSASLHSELGLSHWISLGVRFGGSMNEVRKNKAKEIYEKAVKAYESGEKVEAKRLFKELERYDWDNEVSGKMLKKLDKK